MTRTISTGILGLDWVLGGGVRVLKRMPELEESGSALIRGGAGVGKTVLGAQIAANVAQALKADVAYGCIELLPSELDAQLAGFKLGVLGPRVLPPFKPIKRTEDAPRFYPLVLNLGDKNAQGERLGAAIIEMLDSIQAAGGNPRVVVIDSLSNGYNLGTDLPRTTVDAVVKLAYERGVFLILLEEVAEDKASGWVFAVDTVIHLAPTSVETIGSAFPILPTADRQVTVVKHRFAHSDLGPHTYLINAERAFDICPRPYAYSPRSMAGPLSALRIAAEEQHEWNFETLRLATASKSRLPPPGGSVTAITAGAASPGFELAMSLAPAPKAVADDRPQWTLVVLFGLLPNVNNFEVTHARLALLGGGHPYLSPSRLIFDVLSVLLGMAQRRKRPWRIVLGDLNALRTRAHAEELMRATVLLADLLKSLGLAVMFFDSAGMGETAASAVHADIRVDFHPGNNMRDLPNRAIATNNISGASVAFDPSDLIEGAPVP